MDPRRGPAVGDLPVECVACRATFHAPGVRAGDGVTCSACGTVVEIGDVGMVKERRVRWSAERCEERLEIIEACMGAPPPLPPPPLPPRAEPEPAAATTTERPGRYGFVGAVAVGALFFVFSVLIAALLADHFAALR